jgi:RHS repeat-associated protein
VNKSGIAAEVISHPQGGGAIKGLGESFLPDLHTGTGNLVVPIAIPAGRNGFHPDLSLVYSTGHGNGVFGLAWALGIPGVSRDTTKGLPVYSDDADTFLMSGAEQLVATRPAPDGGMLYRPRTEGLFARIAHRVSDQNDYWEVGSRNGLTNLYGHRAARGTDSAVVRNPDDGRQVFSWSLTETTDPFGNRIEYLYERESVVDDGPHRWDQIYLNTIRYADYGPRDAPEFLVTVDFVYAPRPDAFSQYRAGFEVRTTRRCVGIEIRTHSDASRLTRVYRLVYEDQIEPGAGAANDVSLLRRIEVEGVDGEAREPLPPLDFGYTRFDPARRVYQPMSAVGDAMPERSLAHPDFELADLFGRGLPDVVQIGDNNRYWRNLGDGRFDLPRALHGLPPGVRLGDDGAQLADFDGDGQIDLLVSDGARNGYFPLTAGSGPGRPFVTSSVAPPFKFNDPELRLVDLDGDGITDALRTAGNFELYFHDRRLGWTLTESRARDDFDRFPDVYFSDSRVKLADMTGDGLQDIVFVNAGCVDYWPHLGRGRWGPRITMAGRLDFPDARAYGGVGFDPKRLLLGDVDGDGLADLVYVESGRVTVWLNQSGNGWSNPVVVQGTPLVSDVDAVRLADMLGQGAEGILWTYDHRTLADSPFKFLDLTGGLKPYVLNERKNNAGARTLVEYAPSTRFYLEDERQPATRWRSRLPFPVQVVARVQVIDELSGGKLSTKYRYRQGYWDGDEREFRGFGMVEQLDTETFARYNAQGLHGPQSFSTVDTVRYSPPLLMRTWFHQGLVQDSDGTWSESGAGSTPWAADPSMFAPHHRIELSMIAETAALTADPVRLRHALRSLRGSLMRSELYALDESPHRDQPYTVTEAVYDVREIDADDPRATDRLRIFYPFQTASRTTQWERGSDPMTQFTFTAGHDEYGLPRTELAVAVPRGRDPRLTLTVAGEPYLSTYKVTEYARRDAADRYIVDRIARVTGYEVLNDGRDSVIALRQAIANGSSALRVISHARTFYDGDAFTGLPLGQIGDYGAVVRTESLVFTDELLATTFDSSDPLSVGPRPCYLSPGAIASWTAEYPEEFRVGLAPLAGYVHYADGEIPGSPGGYFVVTERHRYDFHGSGEIVRGLRRVTRDPLDADTSIEYDAPGLLSARVTDAVGLVTEAEYNYRVLQVRRVVDPNGNISEFRFSPAGLVTEQYVRGKDGEGDGANPSVRLEYDLLAFAERGAPMSVRTTRRTHHDSETDVPPEEYRRTVETVEYSDGFGRLLQTRRRIDDTLFGDSAFGGSVLPVDQSSPIATTTGRTRESGAPPNVVVSGWQIYNNKGWVVEKYEPFLAQGGGFRAPAVAQLGQKAVMFYDPRGRVVRTVYPDRSEQLVVFGVPGDLADPSDYAPTAWETYTYDANDNAGRTHANASTTYASHWNTPGSLVVDALGRAVAVVARNGVNPANDWYITRSTYDINGNLLTVTDARGSVAFRYVFDLANRQWREDGLDAGRRDTVFDVLGNRVESRDSTGSLVLHSYDRIHRPTRLWARDESSGVVTLRQRLEYGDGGRRDQPPSERATARTKNLLGQVVRHHDEAGLATVDLRDFKGNVLGKGRAVIADAPIVAVFDQASTNSWRIEPFQVDWQPSGQGSLADVEAAVLEPARYETSATYDALNRVKRLQFPRDVEGRRRTVQPTYNDAGHLERVVFNDRVYVERIAYDARGQRTLIAYGNGVMTRYAYDPHTFRLARLRSEHYAKPDAVSYVASGPVFQDYVYTYDVAGNILGIADRTPESGIVNNPDSLATGNPALAALLASGDALIRRFAYDPTYRLVSATGRECDRPPGGPPWLDVPRCVDLTKTRAYTETYGYDAMGNIERLKHTSGLAGFTRRFVMDSASNRVRSVDIGPTKYTYAFDSKGNMRSETTSRHFEWNHADQMKAFRTQTEGAEPSVHAQYLYDVSGQRVKKLVRKAGGNVEVTHWIDATFEHHRWGGGGQAGENNHVHVIDDLQGIALVRIGPGQATDDPPAMFHLPDHLGSSNVVLDAAGALINREEFTPYGETSFGSFERKRYRYTGMERDEESALAYHTARYYSAPLGRWLSPDPIGVESDVNVYRYSTNNPVLFVDTSGTDKDEPLFESSEPEAKIKVLGGALVKKPIKDSQGRDAGHINMFEGSVTVAPHEKGVEVTVGLLDLEAAPHLTDNVSIVVSGKAVEGKAGVSKKGAEAEVSLFEAGVGAQAGPVKGKVLFGLAAGAKFKDGKIGVKFVGGIGGELEIDVSGFDLSPIPMPLFVLPPPPVFSVEPQAEDVETRSSSVAHETAPPPPKRELPAKRRVAPKPETRSYGCQYGPDSPDPRARKHAAGLSWAW